MNRTIASLSLALIPIAAAGCTQPPVNCTVSAAMPYSGKYKLTAGEGGGDCANLMGDALGFGAYNPATDEGKPDLDRVFMSVRTTFLGGLVAHAKDYGLADTADGHAPHAFGEFSPSVPDGGICRPTELSAALQDIPAVAADPGDPDDPEDDIPEQPATSMQETWTNVEVYVTAASLGTQVRGHYAVTQDTCSAEYDVIALFPQVYCGDEDVLPDNDSDDVNSPDDSFCNADPHPQLGYGSGISPDFPVKCDPVMLVCVLDAEPGPDTAFPVVNAAE